MIYAPTPNSIKDALHLLHRGDLIGLPTETVYGLAADATQDLAVAKIFEKKRRPTFNPLIIHGSSPASFKEHVFWNERAERLAKAFWPGPLTLVLPRRKSSSISLLASAGLDSLAIRIPNHPIALDILDKFAKPLAAPSANLSGRISPTTASHVEEDFPDLFILDGESTPIGIESTIVDLTSTSSHLLRPGGISREEIESIIGPLEALSYSLVKAPGMLESHYAPHLPVRLNVLEPSVNEAFLAFGPTSYEGKHLLNLSPTRDLKEAAANLFKMLRLLDLQHVKGIAVAPIPFDGLGVALNDRLQRAAAPRAP
ncbi:MAG: threonylcarbamoyl-AMP synthase [Proteobacteria bacterium]|nr:threonylcarbamoyl-AMP synthase [Pseudomonadota bacterium]